MGGDYYMAVTVKQIAELANVSRGTVDRVLKQSFRSQRGNAPKSFENRKRTAL